VRLAYQMTTDCQIIDDWLPKLLEAENCCEDSHIACRTGRIKSLNHSSIEIDSTLPDSIKMLSELEKFRKSSLILYLDKEPMQV
jgi:hypothetical protein